MSKLTKKKQEVNKQVKKEYYYSIQEAVSLLQQLASISKFDESIDMSVNLGIDPKKSDQSVRVATLMPKGLGKQVKVAVFAQGENAEKAKAAGADAVGFQDLAAQIKSGNFDFDVIIATPDAMPIVGALGTILGPRGLMPNPKVGTVTPKVEEAVLNAKSGQVRCKPDKNGIIHCKIGNIKFSPEDIQINAAALVKDLLKAKPVSSKGIYLKKIVLSSTMGPGLLIDISSIRV